MSLVGFKARNHPQQAAKPHVDNMATPPEVFNPLHKRFGFTLDVCALSRNAKCERYITPEEDGLVQDWTGERVWCNPPYSSIEPWVVKAAFEVGAEVIVMLVPANRTEQGWWQRHVEPVRDCGDGVLRTEFIAGRTRFIRHEAESIKPNERPPFGCCLLIWGADA